MLEDLGNCVKIHDQTIPAVNIQVEDFPRWSEEHNTWYGIYFEILFEDGTLWEVERVTEDSHIIVNVYPNWYKANSGLLEFSQFAYMDGSIRGCRYDTWGAFLTLYHIKLHGMELTKRIHWSEHGELCG
jgi:hypothetical protein